MEVGELRTPLLARMQQFVAIGCQQKQTTCIMKSTCLALLLALLLFSSCRAPRHIYAPSIPENPFFEKKGDSKLAVSYAGRGIDLSESRRKFTGVEFQGAYALTNHVGLLVGHGTRSERDNYTENRGYDNYYFNEADVYYRRRMTDVGLTFFTPADKQKIVFLGANIGMGFGRLKMRELGIKPDSSELDRNYESRLRKFFITPFISLHSGDYLKVSLAGRVAFVNFREQQNNYTIDEADYLQLSRIYNNTQAYFEPALQVQLMLPEAPFVHLEGGLQLCTDKSYALQSRTITAFMGLSFDLGKIGMKIKK